MKFKEKNPVQSGISRQNSMVTYIMTYIFLTLLVDSLDVFKCDQLFWIIYILWKNDEISDLPRVAQVVPGTTVLQ